MKVTLKGQELRLKGLSDIEWDQAAQLARASGVSLDVCPTCGARESEIPDSGGVKQFVNGTYKFRDAWYPCDCQAQMALRARYLLANIGEEYMRLDWTEYTGCPSARSWVDEYVEKWESFKRQGFGMEFGGQRQGIGKTFCATHLGKELIKRGQRVYFIPFKEMVAAYDREDAHEIGYRMRTTTFMILDEVLPPTSERQRQFFGDQLEALVRHRTNHNLPTFITTNMSVTSLHEAYPRTYSLLAAKQVRVDMEGEDARGRLHMENLELALADEVRPIT